MFLCLSSSDCHEQNSSNTLSADNYDSALLLRSNHTFDADDLYGKNWRFTPKCNKESLEEFVSSQLAFLLHIYSHRLLIYVE